LDESAPIYLDLLGSPIRDKLTPDLLQWLSEYWFAAKKPDAAAQAARALVEKTRDAAWLQIGWCLAGRAYGAKGDAKAARDAYTRATQADAKTPSLAEAALRLGELALADGDHKLASSHFSKAAEAAGGDALLGIRGRAYVGLGRAAKAARDYAEAARYFMSVAVLFDDPEIVPECLSEAAAAFRGAGQADAARQAADELLKRYPQSDLARQASTNAAPATGP
jgi:tetratricopeptide (TPR) repeat protein